MARPLKSDAERRSFTFRVRVNTSEKTRIEQNAQDAGQEPSVYMRSLATGDKPTRNVPTQDREMLLKFLAEIGKQGSNLNQIARSLNRQQDSGDLRGVDGDLINHAMRDNRALQAQIIKLLQP
jgi:hypothetical protein